MITFNILGDCVSRDALTYVDQLFGGVRVLQYHALSSPISVVSEKGDIEIHADDFECRNGNLRNFKKRCKIHDINKTALDYVFKKESDYFILDILDARFPLLRKKDFCFTKDVSVIWDEMPERLGLNMYDEIDPFVDISMEQWKNCIDKLTNAIREHYRMDQIIINMHYGVEEYIDNNVLKSFGLARREYVNAYNPLVFKLFSLLRDNLEGCHVIEFPDNVIADKKHWLGLTPLHYHELYYTYAAKAIKVIAANMSKYEEKNELEHLKNLCSERFETIRVKAELNAAKSTSESRNRALLFAKAIALDSIGDGNFINWLVKNQGKKVAVLKCQDTAGQILIIGLNRFGFDIVLSTPNSNFDKMTEDQLSLCREADIVITANIHSTVAPQRDGIKAICISDLLKSGI